MILKFAVTSHFFENVPLKMLEGLPLQDSQERDVFAVSFDVPRRGPRVASDNCVGLVGVDLHEVLVDTLNGVDSAPRVGVDCRCDESFGQRVKIVGANRNFVVTKLLRLFDCRSGLVVDV